MMSPGAASRKRSMTLSCGSAPSAPLTASTLPLASPLRMMLSRCSASRASSPSSIVARLLSVMTLPPPACSARRWRRCAWEATSAAVRASLSSRYTKKVSPASGTVSRPAICTAMEGPASGASCLASRSARTRP